jgi:hypothetical protein
MYLMVGTRPDLAAAVSIISQFAASPSETHLQAAKRVLRYVKGTSGYKLHLGTGTGPGDGLETQKRSIIGAEPSDSQRQVKLIGYSDANWGGDLETRRSTSGYVFYVAGGTVSWLSKKQATVALSSTEAEYMALTQAAKEAIWLRRLLADLRFEGPNRGQEPCRMSPTLIYEDNQSSIALAKNPVHHVRSKHIDIQFHFIRDKVSSGEIELVYTPTDEMVADAMTKPLAAPKFTKYVEKLGLRR